MFNMRLIIQFVFDKFTYHHKWTAVYALQYMSFNAEIHGASFTICINSNPHLNKEQQRTHVIFSKY